MADLCVAAKAIKTGRCYSRSDRAKYLSDDEMGLKYETAKLPTFFRRSSGMSTNSGPIPAERSWYVMTLLDTYVPLIARSMVFKLLMNFVIIASCVLVGFGVDAEKYGLHHDDPGFRIAEHVFLILFILEYAINVFAYGVPFATGPWGALDFAIILAGVISIWIFGIVMLLREDDIEKAGAFMDGNAWSAFRILRLFQLARTVRLSSKFKLLWSMVRGMVSAFRALMWTFFLMIILFYLFAILGVEVVGKNEFLNTFEDPHVVKLVEIKFGTVLQAMLTSLQIATLDSWNSGVASDIIHAAAQDPRNWWCCALISIYFISLVAMGALVLMNLVTAIIVEQSIEGAKQDLEAMAAWEQKKIERIIGSLERAFKGADIDEDGELSWEELEIAYTDTASKMHPFLTQLGSLADIEQMFIMMDVDGNRTLALSEFTNGVQRCKDDFNKFMLWQIWKKQNCLMQRLDEFLPKLPSRQSSPNRTIPSRQGSTSRILAPMAAEQAPSTPTPGYEVYDSKVPDSLNGVNVMHLNGTLRGSDGTQL